MNYYNEIKNELINNEINRKVKSYSINKSDLNTYYNVGKLLLDAGNKYGENITNHICQQCFLEMYPIIELEKTKLFWEDRYNNE